MLTDIVKRGLLTARGVVGFWQANSKVVIVIVVVIFVLIVVIIELFFRVTMCWCLTILENTQQHSMDSGSRFVKLKPWKRSQSSEHHIQYFLIHDIIHDIIDLCSDWPPSLYHSVLQYFCHDMVVLWRLRRSWTPASHVFRTSLPRR